MAKTQALDDNLLLWMSVVLVKNTSNSHRYTMVGDPLVVFDRDHTDGVVSSVKGNCNVSSVASFDNTNGRMSMSWNYKDFIAEPKCVHAMNPTLFGYNTLTKPKDFTISYDIRTLITALAANREFVALEDLIEIVKYRFEILYNGIVLSMRRFYDPRFTGMDPILCIVVPGLVPFCNPQIGDVIMFPIFHHVGNNLTSPEECNCQTLTTADLANPAHNCNVFRFLSGFIYSNNPFDILYPSNVR
eukprot:gene37586-biopygen31936